jgi:hypothetical protein
MREQARYTLDDHMLRKPLMNPDLMIEQLLSASDYWDKFAKTLTGTQKRKDEDQPFTPYDKKLKGGGGNNDGAASGSGHTNGGWRRDDRRPDDRRHDDRGAGRPNGGSGGRGGRSDNPRRDGGDSTPAPQEGRAEVNPFDKPTWSHRATWAENHSLWVLGSTRQKRQELADQKKCAIC